MFKPKRFLFSVLFIFAVINLIIYQKESQISHSITFKIKLRPVDPRSIMQGDYMRLRYSFGDLNTDNLPKRGFLKITLDAQGFITLSALYNNEALKAHEHLLAFHKKGYRSLHIGAESFMFQEGKADYYQKATHAVFYLDKTGNTILKDLFVPPQTKG